MKKAKYLKNNPNTHKSREDYWTKQKVMGAQKQVEDFKGIANNKPDEYSLNIAGTKYIVEYEEMVEILAAMRTCSLGNEYFISAKLKVDKMWESIPQTDY